MTKSPMTALNKQALREAATEATQGGWYVDYDFDVCHESGAFIAETHGDNLVQNAKFIAAANPDTMLALLDELEAAEKRNAELEAREVNLPAACADDEYFIDGVFQALRYERDVERAIRAAGIGVNGE